MAKRRRLMAKGATGSFGNVNIPDEAFLPENIRLRISIMVPTNILARLRKMASKEGMPYQTLVNQILRDATTTDPIAARLDRIEKAIKKAG